MFTVRCNSHFLGRKLECKAICTRLCHTHFNMCLLLLILMNKNLSFHIFIFDIYLKTQTFGTHNAELLENQRFSFLVVTFTHQIFIQAELGSGTVLWAGSCYSCTSRVSRLRPWLCSLLRVLT